MRYACIGLYSGETFWLKKELKESPVCVESEVDTVGVENILFNFVVYND